jgi:hypothetical protein
MFTRVVMTCLLAAGLLGTAAATTLDVKADGTGTFATIQAAVNAAATGDVVLLQSGTYTGTGNRDVDFKGKAITVKGINPDDPGVIDATIIDAQNLGRGFLFVAAETTASVLEGLTVINGHSDGDGGGIACHAASPTIRKCRIRSCSAGNATTAGAGGGISLDSSGALVSQCILTGNSAWLGGGVYCGASTASLTSCIIAANTTIATSGSGNSYGGGAGMAFVGGTVTVTNCTIASNTSVHSRGGLYTFQAPAPVTVRNCIVWGNAGTQIDGAGLTVTYSDVQGGYTGGTNLNIDPSLTADYHLTDISPCVNAGDPAYTPVGELDIDGQPRVIKGRVDTGADEWTWTGDVNGDGAVDVVDLLYLADAFGTVRGDAAYDPRRDFDHDGSVDVVDLLYLVDTFGNS